MSDLVDSPAPLEGLNAPNSAHPNSAGALEKLSKITAGIRRSHHGKEGTAALEGADLAARVDELVEAVLAIEDVLHEQKV